MNAPSLPSPIVPLVAAFLVFVACDSAQGPRRPTIEIHGSVTDSVQQRPIRMAVICVTDYDIVLGVDTVAVAATDSEGRYSSMFTIHPSCENLSVWVEKYGYYPKGAAPVPCAEWSYTRDFRLVPAEVTIEVRGTVTDAVATTPIELATLYVERWRQDFGLDTVVLTYTNSEGYYWDTFTIDHACENPPSLIFTMWVKKLGYASGVENIPCAEGVYTHDFQLVPTN